MFLCFLSLHDSNSQLPFIMPPLPGSSPNTTMGLFLQGGYQPVLCQIGFEFVKTMLEPNDWVLGCEFGNSCLTTFDTLSFCIPKSLTNVPKSSKGFQNHAFETFFHLQDVILLDTRVSQKSFFVEFCNILWAIVKSQKLWPNLIFGLGVLRHSSCQ